MNNRSLIALKSLLVFLITSLTITGISFFDDKIWNIIIAAIGVAAYGIVGLLYSLHLISKSSEGKTAYLFVFIALLIIGYLVYNGILKFEEWVFSWPLYVKIIVPTIFVIGIISIVIFIIKFSKKDKEI